ncbi:hypothetical protein GCM10007973_06690 [Polymorphobacter multimanifer]|uniref:Putative membrane-anchored protein n=1 Tax=Polymorphobacter multimanifer TaxID=1070431 RepID=A0A841L2W1_9SPHN|nr:hypothetical protein [Polymorphobacter multimanifer]MBB6227169.1 putative membrane-anchored protein [Polymorphobacter multimanifer]GGI72334.1 hypothetical protein GCM10007973_06690 [Polymorphobacter multimanifer]
MDARYYGLIELVMMFAIVGGFTVWTFWSLREKPGDNPGRGSDPHKPDPEKPDPHKDDNLP